MQSRIRENASRDDPEEPGGWGWFRRFGALRAVGLELLAPATCIECRREPASPTFPFCGSCVTQLAWWRRLDGCPHCGGHRVSPAGGRATEERDAEPVSHMDPEPHSLSAACPRCYSQGSALHGCHALLRYEGSVTRWIPAFKHRGTSFGPPHESRLAIEFLSDELARQLAARSTPRPDLVVPVALHRRRQRRRGFNHSDIIAQRIARSLDLPLSLDALVRTRDTPPQANLRYAERRANLRGAFRASRPLAGKPRVWLVDDVLTTGATFEAAAEGLLGAGAEEVLALSLAATPPLSPRPTPPLWPRLAPRLTSLLTSLRARPD